MPEGRISNLPLFLISSGARNVLVKGGHLKAKKMNDILINKKIIKVFNSKKYNSKNTHGTGCTLSSSIATYLSCLVLI